MRPAGAALHLDLLSSLLALALREGAEGLFEALLLGAALFARDFLGRNA